MPRQMFMEELELVITPPIVEEMFLTESSRKVTETMVAVQCLEYLMSETTSRTIRDFVKNNYDQALIDARRIVKDAILEIS